MASPGIAAKGVPPRRRPPRLRTAGDAVAERHATNLELFFDLVFMVAVAELAELLIDDPTPAGFLRYGLLFVPVCWAWVGYTFLADRFDNDDVPHRVVMISAMLAVGGLALALPHAFGGGSGPIRFAAGYVVVRVLLILLYARAHLHVETARPLTARYLTGFVLGAAVWLLSIFVPAGAVRYGLWCLGLAVEMLTPLLSAKAIARVPFHVSHIPERFGLFVLIVLGETVALDAIGITEGGADPVAMAAAASGFLITAALWWLYFDCVDPSPLRRWLWTGAAYVYGHLVIFAGVTLTGVGTLLSALSVSRPDLTGTARWALCGGTGGFLLAIGLIHWVDKAPRGDLRAWTRVSLGAICLVVGALGTGLPPMAVEGILAIGLAGQVFLELHRICPPLGTHRQ
ncbi:low temperature requirement protein A [Actinoplanes subtropicus]|uniref:low temperature requirement protein A n=1 Tax=Actinoplanes subtropicus TaxID=543632 RepID=UPI0007C50886|nr:low temperature requirement protein A [Actinoplanes subtropicus]